MFIVIWVILTISHLRFISSDIDSSILDSIDVQELEYLLKLNIQKGKAFSTLGQGMDGLNAYQGALDVSNGKVLMSVPSITFRLRLSSRFAHFST